MGLIRSGNAPASLQPFSMKDIENQAKAILLRARQQADQLLAAAQAEAEELKKAAQAAGHAEGRREGHAQGREEGLKQGKEQALTENRQQLQAALTAFTAAVGQVEASRRELQAAALKDVIDLAITIAERVTKRQGVLDGQVVIANVAEALKLVVHASDVRIAVHPSQKRTLEDVLPRLKLEWPSLEHIELVEDANLAPGGCRLYTAHGEVDGDLEEQLRRIVAELLPDTRPSEAAG